MEGFVKVHDLDRLIRWIRPSEVSHFGEYVYLPSYSQYKNPHRCWIRFRCGDKQDVTETIEQLQALLVGPVGPRGE